MQQAQAAMQQQLADHTDALALMGAGGAQRVDLWNADRTLHAVMLCDPDKSVGMLYAEHLPSPPAGMVYYVWLTRDGVQSSAGTLNIDSHGESMLIFHAAKPLGQYDSVEISLEEAGLIQPATPILLSGKIIY